MRVYQASNQKVRYLDNNKQNKFKAQGAGKGSDKVLISKKALNIKDLQQDLAKIPEIREEKVQALKEQIQSGTYQVSARSIAQRLLNNDLE
ncbi:MAG: flagellar biosynthesis anti-sigma factor FlgM [Firmicutes bacterium]|nr:flagellar biosynthesis anti-sigma factor FlgM [Bacillota bacterium]